MDKKVHGVHVLYWYRYSSVFYGRHTGRDFPYRSPGVGRGVGVPQELRSRLYSSESLSTVGRLVYVYDKWKVGERTVKNLLIFFFFQIESRQYFFTTSWTTEIL